MEFKQRRLFSQRTFRFDASTLYVSETSRATGSQEWSIQLDRLGSRYDVHRTGIFKNGCLVAVAVIIISTLIVIKLSWMMSLIVLLIAFAPLLVGRAVNYPGCFEI